VARLPFAIEVLSSIPIVVVVLSSTGAAAALWRGLAAFRRRGAPTAAATDPVLARVEVLIHLAWSVFFLLHFVLLAALVESREVGERLSVAGSLAGGLALVGALASLVGALRGER
jgi:hypothetical protein